MGWLKSIFSKKSERPQALTTSDIEKRQILGLRKRRIPTLTQLRYLQEYLNPHEKFLIKVCSLLVIASILVIGIRLWQKHIVWVPMNGGTYTEGLVGLPRLINPVLAIGNSTDSDLVELLFPGLVKIDQTNQVAPDLAESFNVSDDKKTYTFTLRNALKWDDGEPLTVDDIMFTFQLIKDPAYGSPWNFIFSDIEFEKRDAQTFVIQLKRPSSLFIGYLTVGILPAHRFSDVPPANFLLTEDNMRPVGAGPFKFKSLIRSRSGDVRMYELVRNPLYYGKAPYLDVLRFKFYPDTLSALEGLKNREVQGVGFIPSWINRGKRISNTVNQPQVLPQVTALFFNLKNEVVKKKDVRRALTLGLNREEINKQVMNGEALISEGPFAPGFIGFVPNLNPRPYIPQEADQLLDAAGYAKGADGMRKRGNDTLRLVITTLNQDPYPQIAELIKSDWQKLGIEVEVQLVEPGRFKQDVLKPRRYDLLLYGELLDQTLDPYTFWDSDGALDPGLNFSIFINKRVDTLLEEARVENDFSLRHQKYQEVQRIIADEIPAIFLNTPVYEYLIPGSLRNVPQGNMVSAADRFTNVSLWYKKMRPALKDED